MKLLIIGLLLILTSCSSAPRALLTATAYSEDTPYQDRNPQPLSEIHRIYADKWIDLLNLEWFEIDIQYGDIGPNYLGLMWGDLPSNEVTIRILNPSSPIYMMGGVEIEEVIIHELLHIRLEEMEYAGLNQPYLVNDIHEGIVYDLGIILRDLETSNATR